MKPRYSLKVTLRGRFLIYSALLCMAIGVVRQELLICYIGVFLLAFSWVTLIPHLINRSQLSVELINSQRPPYAGSSQAIAYYIAQRGYFSRYDFLVSAANETIDQIDRIPPGSQRRTMTVPLEQRAYTRSSPCLILTSYPFGIFESQQPLIWAQNQIVLPKRCPAMHIPDTRRQRRSGFAQNIQSNPEFHSLKDYQAGDSLKNIHWKATARLQKGISKVYQNSEEIGHMRLIFDPGAQPGNSFEHGLAQLQAIIKQAINSHRTISLQSPSLKQVLTIKKEALSELHLFLAKAAFYPCSTDTILKLCTAGNSGTILSLRSPDAWHAHAKELTQHQIKLLTIGSPAGHSPSFH